MNLSDLRAGYSGPTYSGLEEDCATAYAQIHRATFGRVAAVSADSPDGEAVQRCFDELVTAGSSGGGVPASESVGSWSRSNAVPASRSAAAYSIIRAHLSLTGLLYAGLGVC